MASSTGAVCKSQPPKARKRITGLDLSAAPANRNMLQVDAPLTSEKDRVRAGSPLDIDAVHESSKLLISATAKDSSKAMKIETGSMLMARKRRVAALGAGNIVSKPVRAKKEKDPNEPKRPPTAFFLFMEEFRKTFKTESSINGKGTGAAQVSKEGGEKWRSMSAEAKEPFAKKCADLKEEYKKALKIYNSNKKDSIESTITDNADSNAAGGCDGFDESCAETAAPPEQTSETE